MKLNYQEHSNKPGIYKILNTHTNRVYIGQAKRFKERWKSHVKSLANGKTCNRFLRADFLKCKEELGHDDFLEFHVLEVMDGSTREERNSREEYWISCHYDNQVKCYNFRRKATTMNEPPKATNELREFLSQASKRMWQDPEYRALNISRKKVALNTAESKALQSIVRKKLWSDPKFAKRVLKAQNKAKRSNAGRKSYALASLNRWSNPEYRAKREAAFNRNVTRLVPLLIGPDGTRYENVQNIAKFATEHGISKTILHKLCCGITTSTRSGWRLG